MPFYDGSPLKNISQWSGYFDIPFYNPKTGQTHSHHLFYVFVKNTQFPPNSPLFVWLDGGPGCSSLSGYLREHGPFSIRRNSNGTAEAIKRDFSWTNFAHILYIDSPVGTGFSYSDNRDDYKNLGDEFTSQDLLSAVYSFYEMFPEMRNNRLFITGESYAGHYVPQLMNKIDQDEKILSLSGYIIGNGVTDYKYMISSLPKFLANHFLVPKSQYDEALSICQGDFFLHFFEKNCSTALGKLTSILYTGILNPLDIYAECEVNGIVPLICTDTSLIEEYVNSKEFLEAFGVDLKNTLLGDRFEMCVSLEPEFGYSMRDKAVSQIPILKNLTKKYPLLFYSGDADTIVNTLASEMIMDVLMQGCGVVQEDGWYYVAQNMEGKEIKQFGGRVKKCGNVNFVTVRGAGHQVPVTKVRQTYNIFQSFVNPQ